MHVILISLYRIGDVNESRRKGDRGRGSPISNEGVSLRCRDDGGVWFVFLCFCNKRLSFQSYTFSLIPFFVFDSGRTGNDRFEPLHCNRDGIDFRGG